MGAGWTAVAGSGVQIASMVGRLAGANQGGRGLGLVGALGWGTSMIAGTIQHTENRTAWDSIGVSQAPVERKRFSIALAPTHNGAAVFGTF
jgi:hypothetical protein